MADNGASPETHVTRGSYTDAEKERGLAAVALCSENAERASRELAVDGLRIPPRTLRQWVRNDAGLYQRIRHDKLAELKAKLAAQHEALARRQIEVEARFTERLDRELDDLPIRDVSTAQRNLAVGSGVHSDKAAMYRGDPNLIVENRSYEEIVKALRKHGLVIDSTAEEIPPEQLNDPAGNVIPEKVPSSGEETPVTEGNTDD